MELIDLAIEATICSRTVCRSYAYIKIEEANLYKIKSNNFVSIYLCSQYRRLLNSSIVWVNDAITLLFLHSNFTMLKKFQAYKKQKIRKTFFFHYKSVSNPTKHKDNN